MPGRVAVVTGAARGFGRASACRLLDEGARVALANAVVFLASAEADDISGEFLSINGAQRTG